MLARVIVVVLVLSSSQATAQAHCYDYEASGVELSGQLRRRVFAGPPNYESIQSGDRPDTVWVLRLDRSICVRADSLHGSLRKVTEVQLFVPEEDHRRLRTYLDRHTVFRGRIRPQELGWHYLPIVFWSRLVLVDVRRSE